MIMIIIAERVVCYYGSWSVYRPGNGKFEIEYIDPNLCTHGIYAFVGLGSNGGVRILDSWNEIDKGMHRMT
jgi:chitinase